MDQTGDVVWENTDGGRGYPCFCFRGLGLAAFSMLELQFQGRSHSAPGWSSPAGLGDLREWLKLPKQLIGRNS